MLKLIFNGLAIVFGLTSIWFMFSLKSKMEDEQALVQQILKEKDALVEEKEKFNQEHASRYGRERVKNQKLEEEKFEATVEQSSQQKARDESASIIADLETAVEENQKSIEELKLQVIKEEKDFDELEAIHQANILAIPAIEINKNNLLDSIQNLESEIQVLNSSLENYGTVTKILKEHFDQTTAALFRDKTSRNWLEKGEYIRLSYIQIDLGNGLLGLPVGQEDGVLKNKLFAIRSNGDEICKIKITHAELNQAVASIVPLLGKPEKLLTISEFDLYHL